MEKKLEERRNRKRVYVKSWRVTERARRRTNSFVTDYVKHKFDNVYHEALCFYDALEKQYPNKHDLRKTKEYHGWKDTVRSGTNELAGTVQTLITETTLNEGFQNTNGLTHCVSVSVQNGDEGSSSEQSDNDNFYNDNFVLEIPLENYSSLQPPADETPPEIPPGNENEIPPVNEMPPEIPPGNENEIPPVNEMPPEIPPGNENEIPPVNEMPPEIPPVNEIPPVILPVNEIPPLAEAITDQRIREIIDELRNDPDLNNLFNDDPQPVQDDGVDEGVELPSLEEELEIDYEPFDFDIEVEQDQW